MDFSIVKKRHDETRNTIFEQPLFRAIVVGSTSLTLAIMFGSLTFVTGSDASGFQWGWSWWGLVWFAAGFFVALSFWRAVLRLQVEPSHKNKAYFYWGWAPSFFRYDFLSSNITFLPPAVCSRRLCFWEASS
jgi:hypothetical protein